MTCIHNTPFNAGRFKTSKNSLPVDSRAFHHREPHLLTLKPAGQFLKFPTKRWVFPCRAFGVLNQGTNHLSTMDIQTRTIINHGLHFLHPLPMAGLKLATSGGFSGGLASPSRLSRSYYRTSCLKETEHSGVRAKTRTMLVYGDIKTTKVASVLPLCRW